MFNKKNSNLEKNIYMFVVNWPKQFMLVLKAYRFLTVLNWCMVFLKVIITAFIFKCPTKYRTQSDRGGKLLSARNCLHYSSKQLATK